MSLRNRKTNISQLYDILALFFIKYSWTELGTWSCLCPGSALSECTRCPARYRPTWTWDSPQGIKGPYQAWEELYQNLSMFRLSADKVYITAKIKLGANGDKVQVNRGKM